MIEEIFVIDGDAASWEEAIQMTAGVLAEHGYVKKSFLQGCIDREKIYPTGLPTKIPVALPHTGCAHVNKPGACLLRLNRPVLFNSMQNPEESVNVSFVFNIAIMDNSDQLSALRAITKLFQEFDDLDKVKEMPLNEIRELFQIEMQK
ncbi:PTS sugar transporter subunit IIA [Clostridium sp. KNHs216]|uniref:PTS sugar transporter subunit IIA n=1 Tax=Clostridium sp. KNHs216 TaxID=1550235 RepID=UPI001150F638|nr:PTS sugar transporter subunit IIA [Clostridium sp. KNHs216]TQI68932.1 PTS system galactitol-specific IIA component [Clostridium sp. KNHs216]